MTTGNLLQDMPLPAGMMPVAMSGGKVLYMICVKVNKLVQDGHLIDDPEPAAFADKEHEEAGYQLPPDIAPFKEGVDLLVFGDAVVPQGQTDSMNVSFKLGSFNKELQIFGNRLWEQKDDGYQISPAEMFSRMPITWSNAFGGKVKTQGKDVGYYHNPQGKGWITADAQQIDGTPLPNIEDPQNLIKNIKDLPNPAGCGFYQMSWGLRAQHAAQDMVPEQGKMPNTSKIRLSIFNQAHPDFVLPEFPDKQKLSIQGMTPRGLWEVYLEQPKYSLEIELQNKKQSLKFKWDTICVIPEQNKLYFVGRTAFTYAKAQDWPKNIRLIVN